MLLEKKLNLYRPLVGEMLLLTTYSHLLSQLPSSRHLFPGIQPATLQTTIKQYQAQLSSYRYFIHHISMCSTYSTMDQFLLQYYRSLKHLVYQTIMKNNFTKWQTNIQTEINFKQVCHKIFRKHFRLQLICFTLESVQVILNSPRP